MCNSHLRLHAESMIACTEGRMNLKLEEIPEVDRPQNVDVFLEFRQEYMNEGHKCEYYMVDLDKRAVFWLEEFDATWMEHYLSRIGNKPQLCEHTYLYLIRRCSRSFK